MRAPRVAARSGAPGPSGSGCENARVRVTAKVDYALRALAELAARYDSGPVKREAIAAAQQIPVTFLETILLDLKKVGIVQSQRGQEGGYWLCRPPAEVTLADAIRAVEGPLANVRGARPESVEYQGVAVPLQEVWIALRASMRNVLEGVTLADLVAGRLPTQVKALAAAAGAWEPH